MDNNQVWQGVLGELELSLSKAHFITWFKETNILLAKNGEFVISVPNGFTKEWLSNKYHKNIAKALQNITSERVTKISYEVNKKVMPVSFDAARSAAKPFKKEAFTAKDDDVTQFGQIDQETGLNSKYLFENFIVGPNNELAKAAAIAVCKNPGITYNPFFVYGGVGLGKTHLVQAIGNKLFHEKKIKKVLYATAEKFINDFVGFIKNKKDDKDKLSGTLSKYRDCNVMIIDDIQFLAGKMGSQEAFFNTYNCLFQNNKQIILTSDRPPKAIPNLELRLVSRFDGGMVADVGMPDLNTRKAILKTKSKEKNFNLDDNVIDYIAMNVHNNVRELEGALSRIIARCQLDNNKPTLENCKNILTDIISAPEKQATSAKKIIESVAAFYSIEITSMLEKNRRKDIAWPRQIAMYLMRSELNKSYPTIGEETGGRDHTTAIHAYEKVRKELQKNENLKQEINAIKQKIYINRQ